MIKRVLFTSILAAQFVAFSAVARTDDPVPCGDCDTPFGLASAVKLADDPVPCGDCDTPFGLASAVKLADDPVPCGDCDTPHYGTTLIVRIMSA